MALETLKDIKEIGGFKIVRDKPVDMSWEDFDKTRNEYPVNITDKMNCISFKIQDGPTKENGVNGCQVDTLIRVAKVMIEGLNEKFPCFENEIAVKGLQLALFGLNKRKQDRKARGVEGTNKI